MTDDDFERRLRDVLHDRQLSVTPAPDALERVHAGVRRRHQHRLVASGVAAIAVVAVAVGGVALRSNTDGSKPVAGNHISAATFGPISPTTQPKVSASPPLLSSAAVVAPTPSPVGPQLSIASFTAVGTSSYWVLGTTPDCTGGCTHVERTTDGGKTFEVVGVMADKTALPTLTTGTPTSSTVSDIRFADATHGWLFGGELVSTSDAGDTWTPVAMPGLVVDLAAVHGTAWAVVETTSNFAVYRSDYLQAGAASAWKKVTLPASLTETPSLAVQGSTAYLLTQAGTSALDALIMLPVTGTIDDVAGPCTSRHTARLSVGASKAILWATCGGGHSAVAFVSADNGSHWKPVEVTGSSLDLGGISATAAIYGRSDGPLVILSSSGSMSAVSTPAVAVASFPFLGFTNASQGFAIAKPASGGGQLWRTLDGGHTWTAVSIVD
jgi:hypothetical protein